MAADVLIDFRTKITERTHQVLDAVARTEKTDKAEIARRALDEWAEAEIHRAMMIQRLTRGEGNRRAEEGAEGAP